MSGFFSRLASSYSHALISRPLATKTGTGVVLSGAGDLAAQLIPDEHGNRRAIDWRRLAAFTVFGAAWTGPFNHYWLRFLHQRFPPSGGLIKAVGAKLVIQHALLNPFIYLPWFYVSTGVILGQSKEAIINKVEREYTDTLLYLWTVWVPTTAVVFAVVPLSQQSVVMAVIAFGWNIVLSVTAMTPATSTNHIENMPNELSEDEKYTGKLAVTLQSMQSSSPTFSVSIPSAQNVGISVPTVRDVDSRVGGAVRVTALSSTTQESNISTDVAQINSR